VIDHGNEEYVKEVNIHINGIEGFWGYLKERLLKHHGVAKRNLIYYVKELEFRFNDRPLSTERLIDKVIKILVNSSS
jgi:transposase